MRNNKEAGNDGVTMVLLKYAGKRPWNSIIIIVIEEQYTNNPSPCLKCDNHKHSIL